MISSNFITTASEANNTELEASCSTIVAIATPPGRGGIGIVRLSGPQALRITEKLISKTKSKNQIIEPRIATFAHFIDGNSELIDTGLAIYFKAPKSFTGEDVVELQVHGSPFILDSLVKRCLDLGASMARPGEFSERAFLNGKIDLAQAEAIADLISASSVNASRLALQSLQGEFSKKINALNDKIVRLRIFVEAAIDFPEEEIDFLSEGRVQQKIAELLQELEGIFSEAKQGVLFTEGLSFVLVGRPNAGKSTILNKLAGQDLAIVSDIAGTTRDLLREKILIDELPVQFTDTAGLRESQDLIEIEGIKRAWQAMQHATGIIIIVDISEPFAKEQSRDLRAEIKKFVAGELKILTVFNKIDKLKLDAQKNQEAEGEEIYLSAQSGAGIGLLKEAIKNLAGYQPEEGKFLARRRHLDALEQTKNSLLCALKQLIDLKAGELVAEELKLAHQFLGKITGEMSSDELLGEIFSSFCIGK